MKGSVHTIFSSFIERESNEVPFKDHDMGPQIIIPKYNPYEISYNQNLLPLRNIQTTL